MTSGDGTAGGDAGPGTVDDDARRWAQAEERAAGVVVPDEWPVLRRFLRVELPVVLAVCVGVAVVVSTVWGGSWSWIGTAFSMAALFCMGRGLARTLKRDDESPRGSLALVLTPQQRKQNGRQVLGREPIDPDHPNVLRLAARHLRREAMRTVYSFAGLELLCLGNAITNQRNGWFVAFFVTGMVVGVVFLVLSVLQVHRATAFLRAHPEPSSEPSGASS